MTEKNKDLECSLRKKGARGEPVRLADGRRWLIPTPRAEFRIAQGRLEATPPDVSVDLLDRIDHFIALAPSDGMELLTEPAFARAAFELAFAALAVNYRIAPQHANELLDIHVLPDLLAVVFGKKKVVPAPGGDGSA